MQPDEQVREISMDKAVDLLLQDVNLDSAEAQLKQARPDLLELKESLIGLATNACSPEFDLRVATERDHEIGRLLSRIVTHSYVTKFLWNREVEITNLFEALAEAEMKLAALLAERIPVEIKREEVKDHYSIEEWVDLLVGAVDQEKALAEARDLYPAAPELHQKLMTIADQDQDEISLRLWHMLQDHIITSSYILVWRSGAVVERTAVPKDPEDHKRLIDNQAFRRLAGLLVKRIPTMNENEKGGTGELTPRQTDIICHISQRGSMNIQDLENLYPDVNRRTLQRDLKVMVDKALIISEGATHQTTYKSK